MAYAFDLRLFSARIVKTGNIEDKFLSDLFGGERQSLLQSQLIENKLLELVRYYLRTQKAKKKTILLELTKK